MNELKIFSNAEFGSVRGIEIDGEPWLVGKDVAAALGYANTRDALSKHVDGEDKRVSEMDTPGGMQKVTIINESGLYSLVMSSRLPKAKDLQKWITSEVLPNINDHSVKMTTKANEFNGKEEEDMNNLKIFSNEEFGSVRGVEIDGEPWLVGKDVAAALGYKDTADAIKKHVDDEDRGVGEMPTPGGRQKLTIINESGLYSLILSSKLPAAKKFKRWVTAEVLPAIRRTGGYIPVEAGMSDMEILSRALLIMKRTIDENKETIAAQTRKIEADAPKVYYYDIVLACKELVPITLIAKDYGWSSQRMNQYLSEKGIQYKSEKGIQYKSGGTWVLYQKYADKGYTGTKTHVYEDKDGEQCAKVNTQWTQKGRLFLYNLLREDGIIQIVERDMEEIA